MLTIYLSMLDDDGERQLFSDLYARMKLKCLHVAFSITKEQALAEDALHNAFMKIIEKSDTFFALPCHKQDSLIVIITKNKAIDILRTNRKPTEDLFDESGKERFAAADDVSGDYESAESYERLKAAVGLLPEIYRIVFEMRFVQDMSNVEIADALDVTKDVVATRIKRARKKLSQIITEGGGEYGDC